MKKILLLPIIVFSIFVSANTFEKDERLYGLKTLKSIFQYKYAPAQFKAEIFEWDFLAEIDKAEKKIKKANSRIDRYDYNQIFSKILRGTKDYHVDVKFHTTLSSELPMSFKPSESSDQFFLAYIDDEKIDSEINNINVGDELILFNGKKPADLLKEIQKIYSSGSPLTDKLFTTLLFTKRSAQYTLNVPTGLIDIVLKDIETGESKTIQLIWQHTEENFKFNQQQINEPLSTIQSSNTQKFKFNFLKESYLPFWKKTSLINKNISDDSSTEDENPYKVNKNPHQLGGKKSFIPELGEILWITSETNPFHAYIFKNENKKIGYIRIDHYGRSEAEFVEFKKIIKHFENFTDGLVIDQINNPGGSVFYLYSLVSTLISEPVSAPRHRILLTQDNIVEALQIKEQLKTATTLEKLHEVMGETWDGYPVTMQTKIFLEEYARFLLSQNDLGKKLSDPIYLYQADKIMPNSEVNYTKPILTLINSLDFSGGDFFPAILQDAKRATILGSQTAGAGGYVEEFKFPNQLGIDSLFITGSIAERVSGKPLENYGVSPDIEYLLTPNDLQNEYTDYKNIILETITNQM